MKGLKMTLPEIADAMGIKPETLSSWYASDKITLTKYEGSEKKYKAEFDTWIKELEKNI